MKKIFAICFFMMSLSLPIVALGCGDNPNAMVQGPFKDVMFENGAICFQNTDDKRNIEFYLSYSSKGKIKNILVDTFFYSDAPVELMSVFFNDIKKERSVVVLLRWHVNYFYEGVNYLNYYEIKTYRLNENDGYVIDLNKDIVPQFSGYQIIKDGEVIDYELDNAKKIKSFLKHEY